MFTVSVLRTILDFILIILAYVLCDPKVLSSPLYDVAKEVRPDKSSQSNCFPQNIASSHTYLR
jgi:hypothetical protein